MTNKNFIKPAPEREADKRKQRVLINLMWFATGVLMGAPIWLQVGAGS